MGALIFVKMKAIFQTINQLLSKKGVVILNNVNFLSPVSFEREEEGRGGEGETIA